MAGSTRTDSPAEAAASGNAPTVVDAQWFRGPTRREHRIAAMLFFGFGVFFALLFIVLAGWWFRWVILALAGVSVVYACGHARDLRNGSGEGSA